MDAESEQVDLEDVGIGLGIVGCGLVVLAVPFALGLTDIPSWNSSSGDGSRCGLVVLPGGVLVVDGAGLEAAVQDAHESVRELA